MFLDENGLIRNDKTVLNEAFRECLTKHNNTYRLLNRDFQCEGLRNKQLIESNNMALKLKMKYITIWILPLIIIGGFFYPLLGYLVLGMMAFLLTLSFFRGRHWCANICPRGAFLDIAISKISPNENVPKIFHKKWFKWMILILFMSFLVFRLFSAAGNFLAIGAVFISICLISTVIAVILGVVTKHRAWCVICPMGTLQDRLFQSGRRKKTGNK
ncbi:MAG: 4Fe-4S binding protein [Candidatus Omnitrophota bacterium]